MRLLTVKCLPVLLALVSSTIPGSALGYQPLVSLTNAAEYESYGVGNGFILGQVAAQTSGQAATAVTQSAINFQFNKMLQWQKRFNNYLKNASGYAEVLQGSVSIYQESVMVFLNLSSLVKDMAAHPQGIVTTGVMTDLFIETVSEFVSIYGTLSNIVARKDGGKVGGKLNMLNANDRVQVVCDLRDKLRSLNSKVCRLAMAVRYHKLIDIWDSATSGLWDRDKKTLARDAGKRFKRAAKAASGM